MAALRRFIVHAARVAIALCALHGTANASMFSVAVTPIPGGGIYVAAPGEPFVFAGGTLVFGDQTLSYFGQVPFSYTGPGVEFFTFNANGSGEAPGTGIMSVEQTGANTFNTEMVALQLTGPGGALYRESPTLASLGQMMVTPVSGGYQIDSFFDIFVELSLDGGTNWLPAEGGPTTFNLDELGPPPLSQVPEPGSLLLVGAGALVLARRLRRQASTRSA
jgi:hypothetical protein